jgi:hypothetical protein
MSKNQTKCQKPLEIKWLEALQKTHLDSNSPEQIKNQKLHPEKVSPKIFKREEN